jgi:hypothetical protein
MKLANLRFNNDPAVDSFLGSGATAVAVKRLNSRFVGCDEDEAAVNTTLLDSLRNCSTEVQMGEPSSLWRGFPVIFSRQLH